MKQQKQREQITERCLEIFLTKGIKVSTDEISHILGISKRTLYELFDNKAELIRTTAVVALRNIHKKMLIYSSENFVGNNYNIIDSLLHISNLEFNELLYLYHCFIESVKQIYPDIYKDVNEIHICAITKSLSDAINDGIEQNIFRRDLNKDIIVFALLNISNQLHDAMKEKVTFYNRFTVEEVLDNTFWIFFRGMSTSYGLKLIEERYIQNKNRQNKDQIQKSFKF